MVEKEYLKLTSTYDKLVLDVLILEPDTPKLNGVIQISHGMCEAKERYLDFMQFMASCGYACIIHDHRGHGQSIKEDHHLGYMYEGGAKALVEDLHQVTLYAKNKWPEAPLILLGHSMGSLIARVYLKKYEGELQALILSGSPSKNPVLPLGKAIDGVQKLIFGGEHKSELLKVLSFGPYASKFAKEKSPFAWCCSDPKVVEEYDTSPDCGFTFTVDGYKALFQLMGETYSARGYRCLKPKLPILFIGGGDDPCIGGARKFKKTIDFMRSLGYCNIRGKLYPGMRHEILNETCKQEVYDDIVKYISHIK